MDLFTVLIAGILSAIAYILGCRQRDHEQRNHANSSASSADSSHNVNTADYTKISANRTENLGGDEESLAEQARRSQRRADTSIETQREELIKDQQKELDRLIRELTECKKREQKTNAEIQYLKAKVTQQPNVNNNQSKNISTSSSQNQQHPGNSEFIIKIVNILGILLAILA